MAVARTKGIADHTKEDTREDGSGDRGNGASRDVLLREIEVITNDREEGSSRESGEEGHKEGYPTQLEGQVVGLAEAPEFEDFRPAEREGAMVS